MMSTPHPDPLGAQGQLWSQVKATYDQHTDSEELRDHPDPHLLAGLPLTTKARPLGL